MDSAPSTIIDFRVRVPSSVRPPIAAGGEVYTQYEAVLDIGAGWHKGMDELLAEMDLAGIGHAVLHAEFEHGDYADALNEEVAEQVRLRPDRFSGFGTVSLEPLSVMRAVRQVERVAALGLKGINVQPSFFGLAIDDRPLYPVYSKATELGLAVAIHTGVNYSRNHPIEAERPVRLDQVACDFPEATLIACHGAWPWVPEIVAVARRHPNVLIDFGGLAPKYLGVQGSGWEMMRHFMDRLLREQILFATDWPVFPHGRALAEWHGLGLRAETLDALLHDNAKRLLSPREEAVLI
ncbi:amidohydrolase [Spongiactinospora rosea]|uniref:Amidohydrolase n=1 Tax=Spongiactinospora rosea TaxID=2248750 RepID=A0A366M492_9ACTN|nr:amidohydrolase family protein [Spongiactinospora rosea]RBQ21001.1 amidohydrolase [Spongiactinospora rosea]